MLNYFIFNASNNDIEEVALTSKESSPKLTISAFFVKQPDESFRVQKHLIFGWNAQKSQICFLLELVETKTGAKRESILD